MVAVGVANRGNGVARRWALTLDGAIYDVVFDVGTVTVNGRTFTTRVDGQSVDVNGNRYQVDVSGGRVRVNGIAYQHEVREVQNGTGAPAGGSRAASAVMRDGDIKAIMPGKVIRVAVSEGDTVKEGDLLLILEAMKMENEIRAPRAGRVRGLRAAKGSGVEMGQILCEIECGTVDE
jgi:glutaconyl-CoA/methylmalonyl-CoA decarboxylase subunit gamma